MSISNDFSNTGLKFREESKKVITNAKRFVDSAKQTDINELKDLSISIDTSIENFPRVHQDVIKDLGKNVSKKITSLAAQGTGARIANKKSF